MKKIGLIGGMSWESSQVYYSLMNRFVREKLGGFHSSHLVMESLEFSEIARLQYEKDFDGLREIMVTSAQNLANAKAHGVVICTNTMHMFANDMVQKVGLPVIHIARATGAKIKAAKMDKVLLLGTKFTMQGTFYTDILQDEFGIEAITPNVTDQDLVHDIIYEELVLGKLLESSKRTLLKVIGNSIGQGIEGVILGCTELPLILKEGDIEIPFFDTTRIHAEAAVEFALG